MLKGNPEQGMTLIEVMVAMVILLVGLLGIIQLQLNSVRTNGVTRTRAEANRLLTAWSESVVMGTFDSLTNVDGGTVNTDDAVDTWKGNPFDSSSLAQVDPVGRYDLSRLVRAGARGTRTVWLCVGWGEEPNRQTLFRAVVKPPDSES